MIPSRVPRSEFQTLGERFRLENAPRVICLCEKLDTSAMEVETEESHEENIETEEKDSKTDAAETEKDENWEVQVNAAGMPSF